ncbi:unannotated protein [freshwater metagenome]|uniref:Unannotated protein n=1 Tax=freshwater metagenome TaxID=449393 RepID=A0A6J7HCQ3_9ZZZZ
MFVACGEEARARSTKPKRYPESLRRADYDVGTELTWGSDETASKEIGGDSHKCSGDMSGINCGSEIANRTRRTRMREQHTKDIVSDGVIDIGQLDRETEWFSTCL